MFRHFINSINYQKLINIQANQPQTKISKRSNSLSVESHSKGAKRKTHSLYNGVKRHK